ncbi:MAG: hypothetical protein LBI17_00245 [Rickettsiales bacterium]|nr:hypothetical protein [Rickettsiales bacterium]
MKNEDKYEMERYRNWHTGDVMKEARAAVRRFGVRVPEEPSKAPPKPARGGRPSGKPRRP